MIPVQQAGAHSAKEEESANVEGEKSEISLHIAHLTETLEKISDRQKEPLKHAMIEAVKRRCLLTVTIGPPQLLSRTAQRPN